MGSIFSIHNFKDHYLFSPQRIFGEDKLDLKKFLDLAYADLDLPSNYAFMRKSAPLVALCYLYPKTVVYIPPTNIEFLQNQLKISFQDFTELCSAGIVQPVIGHPEYYARCEELQPILEKYPPSVWERFDKVAELYGRSNYIELANKMLPLKALSKLESSFIKWKKHFPFLSENEFYKQIEFEWTNIFANLCVTGNEELAVDIANLKQPEVISIFLQIANEMFIYPSVIGVGGMPQYDNQQNPKFNLFKNFDNSLGFKKVTVSEDIVHLLKGVDIFVDEKVDANKIIKFHGNSLSRELWAVHNALNSEVEQRPIDTVEKAAEYIKIINELNNDWAAYTKKNSLVSTKVRMLSRKLVIASGVTSALLSFDKTLNWVGIGTATYQITNLIMTKLEPTLKKLILRQENEDYKLSFWELKSKIHSK